MTDELIKYIAGHEEWLMERILNYALKTNYTKFTSTLKEPWRLSISGLSESLIKFIKENGEDIELGPEVDYTSDPAAQFGIIEAARHRKRGIRLDMFLGLIKYYNQSYQDLIRESDFRTSEKQHFSNIINRFYDRMEIAFCTTWTSMEKNQLVEELQEGNRLMTNEKNKYLTIFESLSVAVFIVDRDGIIEDMNFAASKIIGYDHDSVPGSEYYTETKEKIIFTEKFPCIIGTYNDFVSSTDQMTSIETYFDTMKLYFSISFSRSLDISGKFHGTIIILEDITDRKEMEKAMEKLATTDPLTGARNRRFFLSFFEKEFSRSQRYTHQLSLLMIDIDNFKMINDKYGHNSGDIVLKKLVKKAHEILRGTDMFARWGGEEFVVLLPESAINHAVNVAERFRQNLLKMKINSGSSSVINFTVSIGVTAVKNIDNSLDDIIKRADKALYQAKNQGRNRVVSI